MLAVDVVSINTGEVYKTFDLHWYDQGKRHIKGRLAMSTRFYRWESRYGELVEAR